MKEFRREIKAGYKEKSSTYRFNLWSENHPERSARVKRGLRTELLGSLVFKGAGQRSLQRRMRKNCVTGERNRECDVADCQGGKHRGKNTKVRGGAHCI